MKIADMLNPSAVGQLSSPPLSPQQVELYTKQQQQQQQQQQQRHHILQQKQREEEDEEEEEDQLEQGQKQQQQKQHNNNSGKPRSRFSDFEDAIICEGVAKGLTWGQISGQLPHRKRATCFNRYRTLQGVRKSRKRSLPDLKSPITPPNTHFSSSWLPCSPPLPKPQPQSHHLNHNHHHQHQLPALVAPLPRLPVPYSYADRIH